MCRPDQSARTAQADLVDTLRRYIDMSRSTRKPTLLTLRNVSTRINLDRHFSPPVDFLFQESLLYTSIPPETECVG